MNYPKARRGEKFDRGFCVVRAHDSARFSNAKTTASSPSQNPGWRSRKPRFNKR
jgi:hypothetical protein